MNSPDVTTLALLLEKGGLPGLVLAAIYLVWRFAPDRKTPEPAAQVVEALNSLRGELREVKSEVGAIKHDVGELSDQTIDRLARVETEVKNLKERK